MRKLVLFFYLFFGVFIVSVDVYSQEEPILRILPNPAYPATINRIDISPDETRIAIAGDYDVIYDLQTGELIKFLYFPGRYPGRSVDYSSDGKLLVVGSMNKVIVFDTKGYDEQYSLIVETSGYNDFIGWVYITFYPDDSLVLFSSHKQIYIWDYVNETINKTIYNPNPNGASVAFFKGNENIALLGTPIILNLETGLEVEDGIDISSEIREKMVWIITDNNKYIITSEFTYKNDYIDGTRINVYARDSQEMIGTYAHNTHSVMGTVLSSDGKLLAIGDRNGVQIIDFSIPESPKVVRAFPNDSKPTIKGLKFTKDRKKLILATFWEVLVYDISDLNTCVENAVLH